MAQEHTEELTRLQSEKSELEAALSAAQAELLAVNKELSISTALVDAFKEEASEAHEDVLALMGERSFLVSEILSLQSG